MDQGACCKIMRLWFQNPQNPWEKKRAMNVHSHLDPQISVGRGCLVFWSLDWRIQPVLLPYWGSGTVPSLCYPYWSSSSFAFIPRESSGNVQRHSWLLQSERGNSQYLIRRGQDATKYPIISKTIPHKNYLVPNVKSAKVKNQWSTMNIPIANRLSWTCT